MISDHKKGMMNRYILHFTTWKKPITADLIITAHKNVLGRQMHQDWKQIHGFLGLGRNGAGDRRRIGQWLLANGYRVSFGGDEKGLKLDGCDDCIFVTIRKTSELPTLHGKTLGYVSCISTSLPLQAHKARDISSSYLSKAHPTVCLRGIFCFKWIIVQQSRF